MRYCIWKKSCLSGCKSLRAFLRGSEDILEVKSSPTGGGLECHTHRQNVLYKRLSAQIFTAISRAGDLRPGGSKDDPNVPDDFSNVSLIARAVVATTTDHPDEGVENLLSPETRVRRDFHNLCYWSSEGVDSPTGSDAIVFRLKTPFSLVRGFQIRPFEAHFQRGSPIYSAFFVRFSLGRGTCRASDLSKFKSALDPGGRSGEAGVVSGDTCDEDHNDFGWVWTSDLYPMEKVNALQTYMFSPPVLCCGGYVRIELLGKTQKQEIDNLYYVCLSHVKVLGSPLEDFELVYKNAFSAEPSLLHLPDEARQVGGEDGLGDKWLAWNHLTDTEMMEMQA